MSAQHVGLQVIQSPCIHLLRHHTSSVYRHNRRYPVDSGGQCHRDPALLCYTHPFKICNLKQREGMLRFHDTQHCVASIWRLWYLRYPANIRNPKAERWWTGRETVFEASLLTQWAPHSETTLNKLWRAHVPNVVKLRGTTHYTFQLKANSEECH